MLALGVIGIQVHRIPRGLRSESLSDNKSDCVFSAVLSVGIQDLNAPDIVPVEVLCNLNNVHGAHLD